jgi:hypothetical protein
MVIARRYNCSMANEQLHTIRFKRGDDEFELTSTAEEVASWREALEPAISQTFKTAQAPAPKPVRETPRAPRGGGRRRQRAPRGGSEGARTAIRERLLGASLEGFPKIGSKPSALLAGYATLSWARAKFDIDGLTAGEIRAFISSKWRLRRSAQAYNQALSRRVREGEIDVGGQPKEFRLMAPGEEKLKELLAEADTT